VSGKATFTAKGKTWKVSFKNKALKEGQG